MKQILILGGTGAMGVHLVEIFLSCYAFEIGSAGMNV